MYRTNSRTPAVRVYPKNLSEAQRKQVSHIMGFLDQQTGTPGSSVALVRYAVSRWHSTQQTRAQIQHRQAELDEERKALDEKLKRLKK